MEQLFILLTAPDCTGTAVRAFTRGMQADEGLCGD